MILPDATLGVIGGGQLGRMFAVAARTMGYRVLVLDPDPDSPAGAIANEHVQAGYGDSRALRHVVDICAAVTTEFENVPANTLQFLEQHIPVRPSAGAVAVAQDRIREKTFIRDQGLATAAFAPIFSADDLDAALVHLPMPALLKTASMGYDGKGQYAVTSAEDAHAGFQRLGATPCVLEQRVDLALELSVIVARAADGQCQVYPVAENTHVNGILDLTLVPARIDRSIADRAVNMATALAEALHYCGILTVEFFLTRQGELLINEIAPRPHNSGHYTIDACATSQFEQQVRLLCGLPPGDTRLLAPAAMVNLLGDLWPQNGSPAWQAVLGNARAKLHLYGKREARTGRKMGHYTCLGDSADDAMKTARMIQAGLHAGS